ncbi:unnamed protein product [Ectocarpus sp. 8 AP-2014]
MPRRRGRGKGTGKDKTNKKVTSTMRGVLRSTVQHEASSLSTWAPKECGVADWLPALVWSPALATGIPPVVMFATSPH